MLIPGAPLVPILFLSQALNAVLLLVLLPFMRGSRVTGRDGPHTLGPTSSVLTALALTVVIASVTALGVLTALSL